MSKRSVLIVDDEQKVCDLISAYLVKGGYDVIIANDGRNAVELVRSRKPDIIILDLNLPEMDGIEAFRQIRIFSNVPVIMVTARDDETDKIVGLQVGADDYVTKPFSPRELAARVGAVLRRYTSGTPQTSRFIVGELIIDPEKHEVHLKDKRVNLTAAEFKLLTVMAKSPGRVFTRLQLMDSAFGETYEGYDRTIDAHVKNIRQKLEKAAGHSESPLLTVRGVGYKLV